jgi:hypothetical protein
MTINLRHIAHEENVRDTMSMRVFSGLEYQGTAEDKWGLPLEMPQWVQDVHNQHSGRTFIFGTGPSLVQQLPLLVPMREEVTWSVNRMRFWKDLPFTPTYHVVAEPGPVMDWGRSMNAVYSYPEAKQQICINWWPVTAPGWHWMPKAPDDIQMRWEGCFGFGDTLPPIPTGWASPLTLMQVAAWMGFREFYFLGIDTTQTGQAWDAIAGRTAETRNIRSICECFERARRDIERAGAKVYDCTPGGLINREGILPYRDLEEVLSAVPS